MGKKISVFFKIYVFLGLILMIGTFSLTVNAAEELNRDFIAGMPKHFPPHFFIEAESGKPIGFGLDVMDAVARRCGITVKYKVFENWKETNLAAKEGLIDIIPNMGFTSERQSFMEFTSPYETFSINYYIRSTSSSFQSVADIEHSKVGVVSTNTARFILEEKGHYNLVKVDSFEDLAWKLIAGDVDCIAMPKPVMDYLMQKSGLTDHILSIGDPLVEIKRGIALTKGREELFQILQSTMDDFILSQDFKNIYTKWYGKPEPYWTAKRVGIVSAILFCTTLFIMAFWKYRFITRINKELEITVQERTKKNEDSEKRYRQMFLDNQAIKLVIDPSDGKILEANDAACDFYQHPKDKLLSMKINDINTLTPEKIQDEMDAAKIKSRRQFYFSHKLANGEIRDVEVYSGPINVGDETLLFSIIHDISERKKTEKDLKKHNYYLKISQELGKIGTWELDLIKNKLFWTDENCRIFGVPEGSVVDYETFISKVHPDDREYVNQEWKAAIDGAPYDIEHRLLVGGEVTWVREKADVKFDDNGKAINSIGFTQDITERKKAEEEKRRLETRLQQSQKMECVGQLAGGIAHDFNNILSPVIGFTQLSQSELPRNHPVQENLKDILNGAKRARNLVKRILLFSRQQEQQLKPTNIQPIIEESYKLLRSSIPANIDIKLDLHTGNDCVLCDATEIHEIILNLCTNAYHAIVRDDGNITVGLSKQHPSPELNLLSGEYLCLSVKDNGVGIPEGVKDKIFEPYVTTKGVGKGSGLGLSVVYGIVESYKGGISVESNSRQGTEFKIYFPILKTESNKIRSQEKKILNMQGSERILLVDDEKSIIKLGVRVLQNAGYHVTGINDSTDALNLFISSPNDFDLVITDMAMPGMVGSELSKKILTIRPDIPIIICSGYSEKLEKEKAKVLNVAAYLDKPLDVESLVKNIREVLDSRRI